MGLLDDAIREHLDLQRRRGADPAEVERAEREALGPVRRTPERVPGDDLEAPGAVGEHRFEDELEPGAAHAYEEDDDFDPREAPHGLDPLEARQFTAPEAHDQPVVDGLQPTEVHEYEDVRHFEDPELPDAQPASAGHSPPAAEEESWSYESPEDAATPPPASAQPPAPAPAPPEPDRSSSDPADFAGGETVEYDVEAALDAARRRRPEPDPFDEPPQRVAPVEPGEPAEEDVLEETPEFLQDTPEHDRLWFEQRPPKDFDFDG